MFFLDTICGEAWGFPTRKGPPPGVHADMPPPEKGFLDNRMEPWVEGVVYIRARPLTAELDANSRHFSSSKHIYDRACCVLLIFSVCDLTLRPVTPTLHEIRATRPHPGPELGLTLA